MARSSRSETIETAREKLTPYVDQARERIGPYAEQAREAVRDTVVPAARSAAGTAAGTARPAGREARRRGATAIAALRGDVPGRRRRWWFALLLIGIGAAIGALVGMLSRSRELDPDPWFPPPPPPLDAETDVVDLTATEEQHPAGDRPGGGGS